MAFVESLQLDYETVDIGDVPLATEIDLPFFVQNPKSIGQDDGANE